jgi:hypothetical protein
MAADLTIDDLQSVFGEPLLEQLRSANETLSKIQDIIGGKKISAFESVSNKLKSVTEYIANLKEPKDDPKPQAINKDNNNQSKDTKADEKGLSNVKLVSSTDNVPTSLKILPVKVVTDPKQVATVNIRIPAETKVWIENLIYDTLDHLIENQQNKKKPDDKKKEKSDDKKESWVSKLLAGLLGGSMIAGLLSKILNPFKFLAKGLLSVIGKTLSGVGKLVFSVVKKLLGPIGPLLAGAGLAVAGVMTLLSGIKDSGPYKGIKKVLGKGLLNAGMSILKKEFTKLGKMAIDAIKTLTKDLAKGGFVRNFVAVTKKGFRNIFKTLSKLPSKLFGGITTAFKGMFSGIAGKAAGAVAKGGAKGLIAKLAGTAGKFLLKGLKRLPIIGTLIGIGFAISRIMKGDFIGGALDIASAIASAVPVVGTALSIAIDLFSAYRDTQTGGSEKAGKAQISWIEGAKKWIAEKIKYVPIIGPLIDMAKAIGDGDYLGALGYLAKAAIPPLGIIIDLLNSNETTANATSSAISDIRSFFTTIKDSLITAVLNLLPESILGVSIRARVAKMLGVEGYGNPIDDTKANTATSKPVVPENAAKVADVPNAVAEPTNKIDDKKDQYFKNMMSKLDAKQKALEKYKTKHSDDTTGIDTAQNKLNNDRETLISNANKQGIDLTNLQVQPTDTPAVPATAIQPVEKNIVPDTTNEADDSSDSADEMIGNQKEHSNLLKGLIEYQKQTAANTKALINAIAKMQGGGNTVSVNNVSSPTSFIQSPVTSSSFRQAILQR